MKYAPTLRSCNIACFCGLGLSSILGQAAAQDASSEPMAFFEQHIRPALVDNCYECHGGNPEKIKGGLNLTYRAGLLQGGEKVPLLVPGDPDASLILRALHYEDDALQMPPAGKLADDVIAHFRTWISQGAPDPRDAPPSEDDLKETMSWESIRDRRMAWWSFQPITRPEPPATSDIAWDAHPVDRFIKAKLDEAALPPSGLADPYALVRRLYFVLTGLPPAPEVVEVFVAASATNQQAAVESTVDTLLASPAFGERWGRHWMDWMRYTESHGSEGDPAIPHAWRYRDYIIRALNADVPYDDLVREHLAGDRLPNPRINEALGINESVVGTAQFRFVQHGFSPTDPLDERVHVTDNQVDVISKAFLGMTVSCARCHDHKFDPISQKDFYAFYGIAVSTRPATVTIDTPERQALHKAELSESKQVLRGTMAMAWLDAIEQIPAHLNTLDGPWADAVANATTQLNPLHAWQRLGKANDGALKAGWEEIAAQWRASRSALEQRRAATYPLRWDLAAADDGWQRHGNGISETASPAGEFLVDLEEDNIVRTILPAGTYANLLSTKHSAILASPHFPVAQKSLYVRVAGEGGARHRYVIQDYPRNGTIYPLTTLGDGDWRWQRWDLDYWKGESAHIEISSAADQAVLVDDKTPRSWFGITEAIIMDDDQPSPRNEMAEFTAPLFAPDGAPKKVEELAARYQQALRDCVNAWKDHTLSDDQARFLNHFVRHGLLPNTPAEVPAAAALVAEYKRLEAKIQVPTRAPGILEGEAVDQPLYARGNHKNPEDVVPRRFLEAIDARPYDTADAGRLALAESIVDPANPLAARVIANRLWHHVFGRGIVGTPDNFGVMGELPTHPELLDYLASRIRDEGWSLKSMIRLLVTSHTFQLSAVPTPEANEVDPDNRLLAHAQVRRLEAEAIRDAMLATSGRLDPTLFGTPVGGGDNRRSIYVRVIRNDLDSFMSNFDFPTPVTTQGRRDSTNVPAQSLAFMNDPLVHGMAESLAARIGADTSLSADRDRARAMFALVVGRMPTDTELGRIATYLDTEAAGPQAQDRWVALASSLFSLKEFIYLR